eukprot:TRINITY_DN5915_c0_g1_i3.p1 TRINITY_DN5915_c0_g1~~TRINITY_DN5915_c0_g1_i3.p1  ORF type:complete len:372 (+),score=73.21 TRINITY_DN5915_c0_g1_i3:913-2028(+)
MSELMLSWCKKILAWHKNLPTRFIQKWSMEGDQLMIVCHEELLKFHASEFGKQALETDTVFSVLHTPGIESSFCATWAFSETLGRHVPILTAIQLGADGKCFEDYFDFLLEHHVWDKDSFSGSSCDFSSALLKGFARSFAKRFTDLDPTQSYGTCQVHFRRSAARVQESNILLDVTQKDCFLNDTMNLLDVDTKDALQEAIVRWKANYPSVTKWLDWYLVPFRRSTIFKAYLTDISNLKKDNNPQEGTGHDLKPIFRTTPCSLGDCLQDLYAYMSNIVDEMQARRKGYEVRYAKSSQQQRKRKKSYCNDGRASGMVDSVSQSQKRRRGTRGIGNPDRLTNVPIGGNISQTQQELSSISQDDEQIASDLDEV